MKCAFFRIGDNELCHSRPRKIQTTVRYIFFFIKYSKVKPLLRCGKGACSKLQICNLCGANKIKVNKRYHTMIKPLNTECHRLRQHIRFLTI